MFIDSLCSGSDKTFAKHSTDKSSMQMHSNGLPINVAPPKWEDTASAFPMSEPRNDDEVNTDEGLPLAADAPFPKTTDNDEQNIALTDSVSFAQTQNINQNGFHYR